MRATRIAAAALVALAACSTLDPTTPGNLVPRTVDEDPTLPSVALNGTVFHARVLGRSDAPVIVFLHGGPGADHRSMLRLADHVGGTSLADGYRLVFWDQRGAGLSRRHDRRDLTLETYLQDLRAITQQFSPGRPVILVGHSWGAMYATAFINRYPERVAGAVLIESGPMTGATYERLKGELFDLNVRREWLNDMAWSSEFLSADDHVRMDYAYALGDKVSQPRFHQRTDVDPEPFWRFGAAAARYLTEDGQDGHGRFVYDFTDHLSTFRRPVLFIAGERSEVVGPSLQREQAKHYPNARLAIVSGAGHDVQWTHTAAVLELVRGYLASLEGAQP
jgi:proline iminopeptidase